MTDTDSSVYASLNPLICPHPFTFVFFWNPRYELEFSVSLLGVSLSLCFWFFFCPEGTRCGPMVSAVCLSPFRV